MLLYVHLMLFFLVSIFDRLFSLVIYLDDLYRKSHLPVLLSVPRPVLLSVPRPHLEDHIGKGMPLNAWARAVLLAALSFSLSVLLPGKCSVSSSEMDTSLCR